MTTATERSGRIDQSKVLTLLESGLSVFPAVLKNKFPTGLSWGEFQKRRMTPAEVGKHFADADAICIICGPVSDELEALDFDDGGSRFEPWAAIVRAADATLFDSLVIERSPSGGYHAFYRASGVGGNKKLAKRFVFVDGPEEVTIKGKTFRPKLLKDGRWYVDPCLIETRGKGGLIVCDPTPGYTITQGDLTCIPEITDEQRALLLDASRSFDEKPPTVDEPTADSFDDRTGTGNGSTSTPWGDYNERGDFRAVLFRHGWRREREATPGDDNEHWRRPGKSSGTSATINGDRLFYCWSSNGHPFDESKAYNPFQVFMLLEHGGDVKAAGRALAELGYGADEPNRDRGTADATSENRKSPGEPVAKGPKTPDGTGLIHKIAEFIGEHEHFARDNGGALYRFHNGAYRSRGDQIVKSAVKRICNAWGEQKRWCPRLADNVVEYIRVDAPEVWDRPPEDRLCVANGIIDIGTGELLPHSPDFLSTVQLPVKFNPAATCPAIDQFVSQAFPEDATELAYQIPAWLMLPNTSIQKAVLLTGEGGNGKSRYLAMVRAFLGGVNCAGLSLHILESNKHASARLVGKLANICPDLPSDHLAGTSIFKAITGGDPLSAERKFQESFEFVPFCRLIFSANHPPRSSDSSQAFFDRWVVVPFDRTFRGTGEEIPARELDARLSAAGELSGLLNRALAALPALRTGKFIDPESVRDAFAEFQAVTDPLAVWLDRYTVDDPEAIIPRKTLRIAYNAHLERSGRPPATERAFGLAVKKLRPDVHDKQRMVGGKLQWCHIGIGLSSELQEDHSRHSRDSRDDPPINSTRGRRSKGSSGGTYTGTSRESSESSEGMECDHIDPETFVREGDLMVCRNCGKHLGRAASDF